MIKIKDKKATSIGATLTWVVATFIIFFIAIIFVLLTLVISKTKDKPMITQITAANDKLVLTENLISFLNSPSVSDPNLKIKDLIIEKKNEELEREAKIFIDSLGQKSKCYAFEGEGENDFQVADFSECVGKPDDISFTVSLVAFKDKEAAQIKLISKDGKETKITFYTEGEAK